MRFWGYMACPYIQAKEQCTELMSTCQVGNEIKFAQLKWGLWN